MVKLWSMLYLWYNEICWRHRVDKTHDGSLFPVCVVCKKEKRERHIHRIDRAKKVMRG